MFGVTQQVQKTCENQRLAPVADGVTPASADCCQSNEVAGFSACRLRLINEASTILSRYDRQYRHMYISPCVERITGIPHQNFAGRTCREVGLPDELCVLWEQSLEDAFSGQPMQPVQFAFHSPTLGPRYYQYYLTPEMNHGGEIESIAAIIMDITELRMRELALRASEEQFRATFEQAAVGMARVGLGGQWIRVNRKLCEILNCTADTLISRTYQSFMHPEDAAQDAARVVQLLDGTLSTSTAEQRFISLSGAVVWVNLTISLVRTQNGQPDYFVVVMEDISARKKIEENLRKSEQRLRDALDIGRVMMFDWALDTDQIERSDNADVFLGGRPGEVHSTGREYLAMIHPDDRERYLTAMASLHPQECSQYSVEYRIIRPDGSIAWFQEEAQGTFDLSGRLTRLSGLTADITHHKTTEEALLQAKQESEHANRAKDQFLATLSHELRTPLSPILLTAASLERDTSLSAEVREELSMMRRHVELEARLIDDLLDLSRALNGKLRMNEQPIAIHDVVSMALATCRGQIDSHRIELQLNLDAAHDTVLADAARLQQVFWNLLSNAIKFSPEGGRVTVASEVTPDRHIRVSVADNGIGISPADLARIFNAFEQAEQRITRKFGGLGLGLAISKGIIECHHGRIRATSEGVNKGATLIVELPLIDACTTPNVAHARPHSETPRVAAQRAGAPLTLLLVEDHADTARILARLLGADGYSVMTAGSVAEALHLADQYHFDLVISDVGLPDASGFELMKQIRERYGLTGIAMTGYGMQDDIEKSQQAGFAEHLVKPVDVGFLEESIQRVIAQHRP